LAAGLFAQPALNVTITGKLTPYITGSGFITGGAYQSGGTVTGASGSVCDVTFITPTGASGSGATGTVKLTGTNVIKAGTGITVVTPGSAYAYTNSPVSATLSNGTSTTGTNATCSGTAVVTTKVDDPIGLNGQTFQAVTSLNPVGVTYNGNSITYSVPLSITAPYPGGTQLICNNGNTPASVIVTINDSTDGGNDTLQLGNCSLLLGSTFTAKVAVAPGTLAAPLPLPFHTSIVTVPNSASEGTYVLSSDSTTLGITGGIQATCTGCPTEVLSNNGPIPFTVSAGGSAPTPVPITVTTNPSLNEAYAVTTSTVSGKQWLTVNGGTTTGGQANGANDSFAVSVNPALFTSATTDTGTISVYTSASTTPLKVTVSLTVTSGSPPVVTTNSLPDGDVGTSYSATLTASGGTGPYSSWTVSSGTLPTGLTLSSSSGTITGTPTTTGASNFDVTVKDSTGAISAAKALSITINPAPSITTSSLPGGDVGVAYSHTLTATGGTTPYTWTVSIGTLPGGLTLTPSTGLISGTPTTAATSNFSVTLKDSVNGTAGPQSLSIAINPSLSITTTSLPGGEVGVAYSQTLAATGGTAPFTWSLTSGTLPGGLTLIPSTGVISGTPTTAGGPVSFSVTVKDSVGGTSLAKSLSITIGTGLIITTATVPNGVVNVAYPNTTLVATGGTTPYTWTVSGCVAGWDDAELRRSPKRDPHRHRSVQFHRQSHRQHHSHTVDRHAGVQLYDCGRSDYHHRHRA